jgi:IclR family acetate operon transcriptional repressor
MRSDYVAWRPIFDENGQALAAISLSGPKARIVDSRLGEMGNAVRQTAAEITRELGGRTPAVGI